MSTKKSVILVVDDESHILHVVSLKLRNAGYEVVTAQDGEEGLDVAMEQQPDLVITDYHMPIMTGLELCQQLKQHEPTCDTPALMLTARGYSLPDEVLDQTNITEVFSKPFSPKEILEAVHRVLGRTGAESSTQSPTHQEVS